jgi:mRNA interferase RelE/StbE
LNFQYNKKFLKDLASLPEVDCKKIELFVFVQVITFKTFRDIRAEKLQGYKNFYKIRFGHYCVGIHFENNTVTFERVLHRKEIYKYFP